MSTTKLLGTAVGIALENREALKNVSAPARNVAGGVLMVLFRTFWKSTAIGAGLLVVWFGAFVATYVLGGTNVLGEPTLMSLFALFLFLVLPVIVFVRESRKVSKVVAQKNQEQRFIAQQEQARRDAEQQQIEAAQREQQARAEAEWAAFQEFQRQRNLPQY